MGVGKVAVEIADCRRDDGHLRVTWHPEERVVNVSQWRRGICVSATPLELTEVPALVNLLVGALEEAARTPIGTVEPSGRSGSGRASGMDPAKRWLDGRPGAVIDATGQIYGVGAAADYSTVTGLTVENANSTAPGAPDDGIFTAGLVNGNLVSASHVTISGDATENNAGSGIDINSTSYSTAIHNRSTGNSVGISVADDLGVPTSHNSIIGNVSSDNPGGCGIALADHTGAGIFANVVSGNTANDNGLGTPSAPNASAGSGVIVADPGEAPGGGVYNNLITGNSFSGNGHAGVDVHAHAPNLNFSGNVVTFNRIGTNNLRTYVNGLPTTGVYLGDASPLTITVTGNVIDNDQYGIFTAGTVKVTGAQRNVFVNVTTRIAGMPSF
jgi:hypothetical protein